MIGPGDYALVSYVLLRHRQPAAHATQIRSPRELGPYPGRESVGYTNRLSANARQLHRDGLVLSSQAAEGDPSGSSVRRARPRSRAAPLRQAKAAEPDGTGTLDRDRSRQEQDLRGRPGGWVRRRWTGPEFCCYFKSRARLRRALVSHSHRRLVDGSKVGRKDLRQSGCTTESPRTFIAA